MGEAGPSGCSFYIASLSRLAHHQPSWGYGHEKDINCCTAVERMHIAGETTIK